MNFDPQLNTDQTQDEYESEYTPNDEEKKALALVNKLFKKSRIWRKNYDKNWIDNYKFFRGQQWNEQRPSYRHSEVINMVFQAIQSVIPIMTDSRPKFEYLPQEPTDAEFAKILSDLSEIYWTKHNWLQKVSEILYDGHFYGIGYGSMYFDPKVDHGMGDICFKSKDPFYQFPDPASLDVNENSRYFIDAEPVDVDALRVEYPDKGKYVRPDLDDLANGDKTDFDGFKLKTPVDIRSVAEYNGSGTSDTYLQRKALKITLYFHSDEFTEKELNGADGSKSFEQVKKYPNGRKIVIAGNVVLEDGPMGYEDGKFPYSRYLNYILPREFFGISEVEQLRGPNKVYNKIISFALDVMTIMGNPIWKVHTSANIDTDNLMNKPGLVVEWDGQIQPEREQGVQLQPYVLQLAEVIREQFNELSGNQDVSQGAAPTGVTAASAISSLQEAAQQRIRLKSRNLDCTLQDLGQMFASRVMQFLDVPKVYRMTGNENAQKYFKFHIENMTQPVIDPMTGQQNGVEPVLDDKGNPRRKAVMRDYIVNAETGQGGFALEAREYEIRGQMDVKVSTGSSLPFMKAQREQQALNLFNAGLIDQLEVLKTLDWQNYEAVIQRMQEKAMADAQAQAMAQGAPAGGPPPAPVQ